MVYIGVGEWKLEEWKNMERFEKWENKCGWLEIGTAKDG